MKKRFKCGHLGLGQFCHRCDQAAKAGLAAKEEKDPERLKKLKAAEERLYSVPGKTSATGIPTAPVPV